MSAPEDGTVEFLSDAWCALFAAEGASLPRHPGATVSQEMTLERPDGTARAFTMFFVDGAIDRVEVGANPDADLRSTYPEEVWVPWCEGDATAVERAVLTGKARSVGEPDRAALASSVNAEDLFRVLARVHARTRYV